MVKVQANGRDRKFIISTFKSRINVNRMVERKVALSILLVSGILLAVSLGLPALKFVLEWSRSGTSERMFELIYRWQTVYQAGIEFLIALVGGAGVLWQISSDKE